MKITRLRLLTLLLFGTLASWLALIAVQASYREPPNYSRIEKGLYLGGLVNKPPNGTKSVLNLCEFEDSYQADHHSWAKIRDAAPAPSLDWLTTQVEFVARERKAGRTTYVHCFGGVSRGPMVVTAYLMLKNNWTRDETLAYIRERRPQIRPNPAFMDLLAEWEQALQKSAKRRKSE